MKTILAIDIGNSTISIGCFRGEKLLYSWRVPTLRAKNSSGFTDEIAFTLRDHHMEPEELDGSIISSVVPYAARAMKTTMQKLIGKLPLMINTGLETGILLDHYDSSTLGIDRIVDAAAAKYYYGTPCMVFDLGTATTMSLIDKNGCFKGGSIAAGIQVSLLALHEHTAGLPQVEPGIALDLIGTNTEANMRSGAVIGTACMMDGMIERVRERVGYTRLKVILTGGLSRLVLPHLRNRVFYDSNLLLKGLQIIYAKN